MSATDALIVSLQNEIEERRSFQDQLVERAQQQGRDLTNEETELYESATERIKSCSLKLGPLQEGIRVAADSKRRGEELTAALVEAREGRGAAAPVEYRSAGAFITDYWQAGSGVEDAKRRMSVYQRAAAHQTTADNLGIIPNPIVGTLLSFIDAVRPIVTALGPQAVPGGRFLRPKVTQHTDVGKQTAEKTELVSRKMLITSVPVNMDTYGGYVNVSRQNIDWSMPQIMDLVVNDLAAQYAIETEQVTAAALVAAATAQTPAITPTSTAAEVTAAVWKAAGSSFAAMQGAGRLVLAVSPDMMGAIGALFPPINPNDAQSTGFSAANFGQGAQGSISGVAVAMSSQLPAGTALMINTAAAEVYEQRIGTLSVTEPSVLGVQVAYAGYFAAIVLVAAGVIKLTA